MITAADMKAVSKVAMHRRASEYAAEQDMGREAHQRLRGEIRAAIPRILERDWLPQIKRAAEEGRTITVLQLGRKDERSELIQRYGAERMASLGYQVFFHDPNLSDADDSVDRDKLDITVTW